jgi:ATPase subunit of ABC transporter with duplicated ATPase domains
MLFDDVNLSINPGQKIACIGNNGAGKTSLIKLLIGQETPDQGEVKRINNLTISYMPQDYRPGLSYSIRDAVMDLCGLKGLSSKLETSEQLNPSELENLLAEYEAAGGYEFDHKLSIMMEAFGLNQDVENTKLSSLSGGQRGKVTLIATLLKPSDLIILDEPTNNLDLSAIVWLQEFLKSTTQALFLVSHDTVFLDSITDTIWEIDVNKSSIISEHGLVSLLYERKARQIESDLRQQEVRNLEIKRLGKEAAKLRSKSASGSNYQGTDNDKFLRGFKRDSAGASGKTARILQNRIEDLKAEPRVIEDKKISFDFGDSKRKDGTIAVIRNVQLSLSDNELFHNLSLNIDVGERVLLLGSNGVGKTTLIKLLSGQINPDEGEVWVDKKYDWFYLDQDQSQILAAETPALFLKERTQLELKDIYTLLASVGISYELAQSDPRVLSPGQRVRFMLIAASVIQANILVLDEPTNHLDQLGYGSLISALSDYQGTIILVSHDRKLLEKFNPTHIYLLENKNIKLIENLNIYLNSITNVAKRLINKL